MCENLLRSITISQVRGRSRTEPIRQREKDSDLRCGDAPALVPLVADAGVERQHIFAGVRKAAAIRFADLENIRYLVGTGAQLGGQGNFVPDVQRVDLAEVAVGAPVVGGEADIAVPDGGVLKVPDALGKRLAVRSLINADAQIQSGDLQSAEGAVL